MSRVHPASARASSPNRDARKSQREYDGLPAPAVQLRGSPGKGPIPVAQSVFREAPGLSEESLKCWSKFSSVEESDHSRHRVVSLAAQGMTTGQAFGAKPGAPYHAVSVHCVMRIIGTGGQIPARRRQQRGKARLVGSYAPEDGQLHSDESPRKLEPLPSATSGVDRLVSGKQIPLRNRRFLAALLRSPNVAFRTPRRAMNTASQPEVSWQRFTASLSLRLTRFRKTAFPHALADNEREPAVFEVVGQIANHQQPVGQAGSIAMNLGVPSRSGDAVPALHHQAPCVTRLTCAGP